MPTTITFDRSHCQHPVLPPKVGSGPPLPTAGLPPSHYERQVTRSEGEADALRQQLQTMLDRERSLRAEMNRLEYELKCSREDYANLLAEWQKLVGEAAQRCPPSS